MSEYKSILAHADSHFQKVFEEQRQHLECGRGCSFCCHGLFEIGAADVAVIADALRLMPAAKRKRLVERAAKVFAETGHPDIRVIEEEEKESFFDRTSDVPCPALSRTGECTMYAHRPLVCRTFGLPIRDGESYIGDICDLNFTNADQEERERAAWDLQWEDAVGAEDQFTIPEAILLAARLLEGERT